MSTNPFASAYLETKVLSASPLQLVYLAYEGAIEAVVEARDHLLYGRIKERSQAITRAQLLIAELQSSLDFKQGGDLSVQLGRLYDYMQHCLREANFKQIEKPLVDAQGLLDTLANAWKEIAEKGNTFSATTTASAASPARAVTGATAPDTSSTNPAYDALPVETPAYDWAGSSRYSELAYLSSEFTL